MEVATYADLLNQKIIVPSVKGNYIGVERHFFTSRMRSLLEKIRIDEKWYLRTHPDVQEAIVAQIVPTASEHYIRFGFFEHRMPYRIQVDETWYLAQYSDVREAITKKHFVSGQAHFDADGFREGRIPYPNFTLQTAD